jgi:hypothetical protein
VYRGVPFHRVLGPAGEPSETVGLLRVTAKGAINHAPLKRRLHRPDLTDDLTDTLVA